jgi:hypothetical protein
VQVLIVKNLLERHVVLCATNGLGLSPEFAEMSRSTVKVLAEEAQRCEYVLPVTEQSDNAVTRAKLLCKLRCCHAFRS